MKEARFKAVSSKHYKTDYQCLLVKKTKKDYILDIWKHKKYSNRLIFSTDNNVRFNDVRADVVEHFDKFLRGEK